MRTATVALATILTAVSLSALGLSAVARAAEPYRLPVITAADLDGRPVSLPADLPADRSILLLGFAEEHQTGIDRWVAGLKLAARRGWLELPVIDNPGAIGRWFIQEGMRRGLPDPAVRARVISVYTDKAEFLGRIGVQDDKSVAVLVVDRSGRVLAMERGDFDPAKGTRIEAVWGG